MEELECGLEELYGVVPQTSEEVRKFAPEYIAFLESIEGKTPADFIIKKVPEAGIAVWRAIDKATGIDIGGGSNRKLAQDVINRVVENKAKLAKEQ